MQQRDTTTAEQQSAPQGPNRETEQRLLEERREVIQEIFAGALNANGSRASLADPDYAELSQIRDLEYSRRESLNQRLRQLDDALARVHAGVYGRCSECGAPIAEKRLAADPAVTLCVGCKELNERTFSRATL